MNESSNPRSAPWPEFESWDVTMHTRPVRNAAAEVVSESKAGALIRIASVKPRFLVPPVSWIIRPRLWRQFRLDPIGTELWNRCDGRRTMESLVDVFARENRLTFHEARTALTGYLQDLTKRGLVAAAVPEQPGRKRHNT